MGREFGRNWLFGRTSVVGLEERGQGWWGHRWWWWRRRRRGLAARVHGEYRVVSGWTLLAVPVIRMASLPEERPKACGTMGPVHWGRGVWVEKAVGLPFKTRSHFETLPKLGKSFKILFLGVRLRPIP